MQSKLHSIQAQRRSGQEAGAAISIFILLVCVSLAFIAWWFARGSRPIPPASNGAVLEHRLSPATQSTLERLQAPLEIHFYALLDPNTVSKAVQDFASRVKEILAEYDRAGGDRLTVIVQDSPSNASAAAAASADGIKPFNLSVGDACYLGIAVLQGNRRETIPQLSPEWESALEADITRTITRVSSPQPAVTAPSESRIEPAVLARLQRAIPDLKSVTLDEGRRIIREDALAEFKAVAQQMQDQVAKAERHLASISGSAPAADQQAAMQELQQLKAAQAQSLKAISDRSQLEIEAFEMLKRSQDNAPR